MTAGSFGLIADDLTGACDAASAFLEYGRVTVAIWPNPPATDDAVCAAISTETRLGTAEEARARSRGAALRLQPVTRRLYGKVDSMLRGHPGPALAGMLEATGGRCLFAPALPAMGRTTKDGVQRWPGGEAAIRPLLDAAGIGERVEVADAETDADLARIAARAVDEPALLPAGTAGLAAQLPAAFGLRPVERRPVSTCARRPLAIVGSPAAAAQADFAEGSGWKVIRLGPDEGPPPVDGYDALLLTGGETAVRVLRSLGATGLELIGLAAPLTPLATVVGGSRQGMPVVLKAGAFGGPDAVARGLATLAGGDA